MLAWQIYQKIMKLEDKDRLYWT